MQAGVPLLLAFDCTEIQLLLVAYQGEDPNPEIIPLAVN
jgi:hypothetical protein